MVLTSKVDFLQANLNEMSPEDVRSRLKDVMKSGERFERRHNRQWRVLDDEFRAARRRLRHAVMAMLALRRRVRRVNEERRQRRALCPYRTFRGRGQHDFS